MKPSIQDTTLWTMTQDKDHTSFEDIQEYLSDTKCYSDIEVLRNIVASWNLDPIYSICHKWVVQMILISQRPDDLGIENDSDIYKRAIEWIQMVISDETAETFIKKTMTLKVAYDNWRKRDICQQIQLLVEMYLYYQDILVEFDYYTEEERKQEPDMEKWIGFYKDFAASLLELIKMFVPKNYKSWIENTRKQRNEQENNNPEIMEKMRKQTRQSLEWAFWKNREYTYLKLKEQESDENEHSELCKWRKSLLDEWNAIGDPSIEVLDESIESDDSMMAYMVESCMNADRPTMRDLYQTIIMQYESRQYSFIEVASILFQRWSMLRSQ
jgi:hypothetical protein